MVWVRVPVIPIYVLSIPNAVLTVAVSWLIIHKCCNIIPSSGWASKCIRAMGLAILYFQMPSVAAYLLNDFIFFAQKWHIFLKIKVEFNCSEQFGRHWVFGLGWQLGKEWTQSCSLQLTKSNDRLSILENMCIFVIFKFMTSRCPVSDVTIIEIKVTSSVITFWWKLVKKESLLLCA